MRYCEYSVNETAAIDNGSVAFARFRYSDTALAPRYPERDEHKQRRWNKEANALVRKCYCLSNIVVENSFRINGY